MNKAIKTKCVYDSCGKKAITLLEDDFGEHPICQQCLKDMELEA